MSIIDTAEAAVAPYLIWVKVAVYAIAAAVLIGVGAYGMHRWDASTIADLKAADAAFATKSVQMAASAQKKTDDLHLAAAVSEAQAQQQIIYRTQTIHDEVISHVPITYACIPVGLVRLLNSAASPSPAIPDVAPGQPDDACAPVSWRSLGDDIIDDYGIGNQNAEQLNALEAAVRVDAAVTP